MNVTFSCGMLIAEGMEERNFSKEKVNAVIRKHECEVDENDNVVKGNRRSKISIVIFLF